MVFKNIIIGTTLKGKNMLHKGSLREHILSIYSTYSPFQSIVFLTLKYLPTKLGSCHIPLVLL